jgi:NAD+ synthase
VGLQAVRDAAREFRALGRWDTPEAFELMVRWTKARLAYSGAKGFVFGASGGVDSSLVACVLARVGHVTAFVLPCGSHASDERDARALCAALKIPVERIDLQPAFEAVRAALGRASGTAEGNLKTRLRTMALFHEAQRRHALHVGTGDLDEGWVGYYTKGSSSDLGPIASLHKDEVRVHLKRELSRYDARLAARLARKPADAGLSGRTAEEELGVSYRDIARSLEVVFEACHVYEGGLVPKDAELFERAFRRSGVGEAAFLRVAERIYRARHKAFGAPVLWRDDSSAEAFEHYESE